MTHFGLVLTGGPYQTQRWETAYRISSAALDRQDKVTIFLFMDGVYNVLSTERFPAMERVPKDYFSGLIQKGATIHACEVCANNRGLEEGKEFLPGVKLSGAMIVSDIVARCDRVITL